MFLAYFVCLLCLYVVFSWVFVCLIYAIMCCWLNVVCLVHVSVFHGFSILCVTYLMFPMCLPFSPFMCFVFSTWSCVFIVFLTSQNWGLSALGNGSAPSPDPHANDARPQHTRTPVGICVSACSVERHFAPAGHVSGRASVHRRNAPYSSRTGCSPSRAHSPGEPQQMRASSSLPYPVRWFLNLCVPI